MVIDPSNSNFGKIPAKKGYAGAVAQERALSATSGNANAPASKPTAAATDNVSLSAKAQSLARLESRVAQAPDVDRKKVDAVKQAIANGTYTINPDKIAKAMLDAEQQTA